MTRKNQALLVACPACGAPVAEMCRRVRLAHLPRQVFHAERQAAGKAVPLQPLADLFWPRVDIGGQDDCWPWLGVLNHAGYGVFAAARNMNRRHEGRSMIPHRFAYEELHGAIPAGLQLDHLCHTNSDCLGGATCEHRRCVNPAHLEAVTPIENVRRALFKATCDKGGCSRRNPCRPCIRAYRTEVA